MVKFKRKKFFWIRLSAFTLIAVACGIGFIWNQAITEHANRNIFGNERPHGDLAFASGLDIHFIDVGQGDAAVIRFPDERIMIVDAGTNTRESRDAFSHYLRTHIFPGNTPRVVHYFVATHSHADHIGAAYYLLQNYYVEHVIRPLAFTQNEINTGVPLSQFAITTPVMLHNTVLMQNFVRRLGESTCISGNPTLVSLPYRGRTMTYGGAEVLFLSPYGHYFNALNRLSTIFTITFQGRRIMFTGDSYVACEMDMLTAITTDVGGGLNVFGMPSNHPFRVCVLDVSHHGSTTSTSQAFINMIQPSYAIIQVGQNNFGHPHSAIIRRLENADATILTTRMMGDILVRVSAIGEIEVNGVITPGEWFSYWMLVGMVLLFAFATLLAMDFITKNPNKPAKQKRARKAS